MNYIEIITLLVSSGTLLAVFSLIFKLGKYAQKIDSIENRVGKIEEKMEITNMKIARIEGQLIGPPHWEPKIVKGHE